MKATLRLATGANWQMPPSPLSSVVFLLSLSLSLPSYFHFFFLNFVKGRWRRWLVVQSLSARRTARARVHLLFSFVCVCAKNKIKKNSTHRERQTIAWLRVS